MRVLILGAGGHAQVVADALLRRRIGGQDIEPIGYLDDDPLLLGKEYLGLPVLGAISRLTEFEHDAVIVALGENSTRRRVFRELGSRNVQFANAIHPSAILAPDVKLGVGIMVMAGVVVNTGTMIGDAVILNTSCSVDHHGVIGSHAHLAPGVHVGGDVTIGEGALLGVGASVSPGQRVGAWSIVGAGSCVLSDIPASVTAVGVPARVIERRGTQ